MESASETRIYPSRARGSLSPQFGDHGPVSYWVCMKEVKNIERGNLWGTPEKGHRRTRHWLLSTTKTVARTKCRSYGRETYELDFTLKPQKITDGHDVATLGKVLYARFCCVLFDCVIPNAIIARDAGVFVKALEVSNAINQGMRMGNGEWLTSKWADYVDSMGGTGWIDRMVQKPVDLYIYGKMENGERIDPYPLERYVRKKIAKYAATLPRYTHTNTPKLNMLIEEFRKDPSICKMGYTELIEKFGVSNNAVSNFKKWLKEADNAE